MTLAKQETIPRRRTSSRSLFLGLFLVTISISVVSDFLLDKSILHQSLFDLTYYTGPATRSLLHGQGLAVCGEGVNPYHLCFHAARMPMAASVVAAGALLFGDSYISVSLFKIFLFLLPLEFAIFLVCQCLPRSRWRRVCCILLLLVPFGMTIFIANVVNLPVEEDYVYSLIACGFAIVLFGPLASPASTSQSVRDSTESAKPYPRYLLLFVCAVDALYLSKSSMSLAVAVLTVAYFFQLRGVFARLVLLVLVAAAPFGWALYLHHASGRYSVGTSLDGINLHKGNDSIFLDHYPPPPLTSLDDYDDELTRGQSFPDEWSFNDYHLHAAIDYIRAHPRLTLEADWRKFRLVYLSITKYGTSDSHGLRLLVEKSGLLLFRLIFWSAMAYSLYALFARGHDAFRGAAATYLALAVAAALPYILGFGYTRHASVLIYPACLMGCRILCAGEPRT